MPGFRACVEIAVFIPALGGVLSWWYKDIQALLVTAACTGVFLLIFLLVFGSRYIELWGRVAKMRVYAPEEDMEFVKRHIRNRLTGGCDIRYIS